ncbi:hypothetical protein J2W22_002500 [Sphingomonas kyeonggiensis]|uniref:hypothetical protein n=1 Tax=Sphingomonas kyeonggiensis TaxID=1268553 RepID=UPI00277F6D0C|nr:hypothetical protein [Sphingomonas kyeonggiensis]MDQ0250436.1 hypothetical protein [Sphingomonas kyeonggiensis]
MVVIEKAGVDHIEVGRKAHELEVRHGDGAYRYAQRLSEEAGAKEDPDDHRFWSAVAAMLRPR